MCNPLSHIDHNIYASDDAVPIPAPSLCHSSHGGIIATQHCTLGLSTTIIIYIDYNIIDVSGSDYTRIINYIGI